MDPVVVLRACVALGLSLASFALFIPIPKLGKAVLAAMGLALAVTGFVASRRIERARGPPAYAASIRAFEGKRK